MAAAAAAERWLPPGGSPADAGAGAAAPLPGLGESRRSSAVAATPKPLLHSFAGCAASATATLATYPLDYVKVRFQAQDGTAARGADGTVRFTGVREALRVSHTSHGLQGMYRGVGAALTAGAVSWGLYFGLYRSLQARWRQLAAPAGNRATGLSAGGWGDFACATAAGLTTTAVSNPLWLVKTRMQLQETGTPAACSTPPYRSLLHGLSSIVRAEGPRGLFTGLGPGLLMSSHGAVQMSVYERLKAAAAGEGRKLSSLEVAACTILAKSCASAITTPLCVLRTRIQDPRNALPGIEVRYNGTVQALRTIVAREGVTGLWRGLVPSLCRTIPNAVVTFVCYEAIVHHLLP
eukprot:TRINITY_DN7484_c0_g1_i1.p2 TRINITY_DN7484_c0_g1~~TRINITY_DN7484_c0_g1_i1.p2  ORF type:complete len:370 (+),score=93.78 TRINITY_DN7484_c0_g1_i1:63-1112(+)